MTFQEFWTFFNPLTMDFRDFMGFYFPILIFGVPGAVWMYYALFPRKNAWWNKNTGPRLF